MLKTSLLFALPLLFCSCAGKDDANVEEPKVPISDQVVDTQLLDAPLLEAAVASVQLQEDCPDAPAPTPAAPAKRAAISTSG